MDPTKVFRSFLKEQIKNAPNSCYNKPAMSSPPTVTTPASVPVGLTNFYEATTGPDEFFLMNGEIDRREFGGFIRPWSVIEFDSGNGNQGQDTEGNKINNVCVSVEFVADADDVCISISDTDQCVIEVCDPVTGEGELTTFTTINAAATHPDPAPVLLEFGLRAERLIRVRSASSKFDFYGVSVGPTESVWKPDYANGLTFQIFGDSMASSTGASTAGCSWGRVFGDMCGFSKTILSAVGGTGFVNNQTNTKFNYLDRIDDIRDVDVLGFQGSVNDNAFAATTLPAQVAAVLAAARTRAPNALIFVTGVALGKTASDLATENALKTAFDAWDDDNKLWLPFMTSDAGQHVFGTGRVGATAGDGNADIYIGTDGTHPPNAGHVYQALRAKGELLKALA